MMWRLVQDLHEGPRSRPYVWLIKNLHEQRGAADLYHGPKLYQSNHTGKFGGKSVCKKVGVSLTKWLMFVLVEKLPRNCQWTLIDSSFWIITS